MLTRLRQSAANPNLTGLYAMTARHSAKAAERLGLKMSRRTTWCSWMKWLWTVACADCAA